MNVVPPRSAWECADTIEFAPFSVPPALWAPSAHWCSPSVSPSRHHPEPDRIQMHFHNHGAIAAHHRAMGAHHGTIAAHHRAMGAGHNPSRSSSPETRRQSPPAPRSRPSPSQGEMTSISPRKDPTAPRPAPRPAPHSSLSSSLRPTPRPRARSLEGGTSIPSSPPSSAYSGSAYLRAKMSAIELGWHTNNSWPSSGLFERCGSRLYVCPA